MLDDAGMNSYTMEKLEKLVDWFKDTYFMSFITPCWTIERGDDTEKGKPYKIYLEWYDEDKEDTTENSIQLVNGVDVSKVPVIVLIRNFAQKIWKETRCKNFEIFYRINSGKEKEV